MYSLKDNGVIKEITCGNNFEYVLEESGHFAKTDYMVLQSQTNGIFIRCMKMKRNGKLSLYYLSENNLPMETMLQGVTPDTLIAIATNFIAGVIEVKENGFLVCQCIDLSWDKIFVEPNTLKVRLVYLPFSVRVFDSYAEFESELRASIISLINKVILSTTERLNKFVMDLRNGSLSLEEVYQKNKIDGGVSGNLPPTLSLNPQEPEAALRLAAMDAPEHFEIVIDSDDVLIGSKQELVDKVITYNKTISRKHCRIKKVRDTFYINDEGSSNGTFLNGIRLAQGQSLPVAKGDIIRLATSDFKVL